MYTSICNFQALYLMEALYSNNLKLSITTFGILNFIFLFVILLEKMRTIR